MEIRNFQNEPLGQVEDLALDLESGRVLAVFLVTGGLLGLGERTHSVASGGFHHDGSRRVLHLDQSQDAVHAMPLLDASNWRTCYNPGSGADESRPVGGITGTAANTGGRASGASDLQKASQVLGLRVGNAHAQTVGRVENVVVDLPAGRIVAVVIASGSFLGLRDELSAVPAAALRFNEDGTALRLDTTRETLGNAPHFRAGEWPDFSQRAYATRVHQAYQITPYFDTNSATGRVVPNPGPTSSDLPTQ